MIRLAYDNITGPNLINPYKYDADCVFVDIKSTNSSAAPVLPDLGASVTPTATGTATANATGAASSTGSTATTTAAKVGSAGRVQVGVWVGLGAVVVAYLLGP